MPACKYEYAFRIHHTKQKKTDTLLGKGCLLLFVIHYLNNALQRYNYFQELQTDYKRVIKKFNTLAKQYTRVKNITDNILVNQEKLEQQNQELKEENNYLEQENNRLNNFLEKTYEYVSILFNFPKDRLKRLVKDFVDKMKGN